MALNDDAVIVAAQGFVYVNSVGATSPTPSDIDNFVAETFGCQTITVVITGAPTAGTFTLTVGGTPTSAIPYNATAAQVQAAVEAVTAVGAGNTVVGGTLPTGVTVTFCEALQGTTLTVTATGSFTGGTTPAVTSLTTTPANGWKNIGHTSRGKMPEFGFDGGKLEMRGTWQKERLREVRASAPVEDHLKVILEQWDNDTLELYFGADASTTPGIFGVDGVFNPIEKSFLVVIVDGDDNLGFYASKASVQRDASVDLPIDDFAGLPIMATFLNLGSRRLYDWISTELFS